MSLLIEYVKHFARFQRNARLYLISNALSGVTAGIILVLYNLYLVSLGYGTDFVGLVLFVATLGAGLAIFPAGFCIDHFGGKAILIWASFVVTIGGAGQLLLRQPLPLLISGFIVGIAGAFILVVNAPFLTRNSAPAERSLLFSLNIVVSLVTTVLGELWGGVLPSWFHAQSWLMAQLPPWLDGLLASQPQPRSYQLAMLFAGLIAVPSFIPLFLLREEPLRAVPMVDPTRNAESYRQQRWSQIIATFHRWRKIPVRRIVASPLCMLVLTQALVGLGAGLFIPYFNIYFVKQLGASPALFGVIDGGANAMNALFTLFAPWLAARIGKIKTITFTRLVSLPLLLTIGLSHLLPLVAVLYLFRQGTMDMAAGIFQVFSMEAIPRHKRGQANSIYQAVYQGAWALTTPLGGLLIAHVGYPPVYIAGAICYLASTVLLWVGFGHGIGERLAAQNESLE